VKSYFARRFSERVSVSSCHALAWLCHDNKSLDSVSMWEAVSKKQAKWLNTSYTHRLNSAYAAVTLQCLRQRK
jgi:hypothetical protein